MANGLWLMAQVQELRSRETNDEPNRPATRREWFLTPILPLYQPIVLPIFDFWDKAEESEY